MNRTSAALLTLAALLTFGCKKSADTATPVAESYDDEDSGTLDDDPPNSAAVNVDQKLASLCNLPEARFDFDSANISPPAKTTLDALAECMLEGPAKGESVRLVGHADNRGEEPYNLALGQRRAGSVAQYLGKAGVPENRATSTSRGELDALGEDDDGWAADRRVDILLAR